MPALFTSTSTRPKLAIAVSIISAMEAGFDMSAPEYSTLTPKSAIARLAAAISSGLPKPFRMTEEPAPASARAMPSPMPLVEPVTNDTFPLSDCATVGERSIVAISMARGLLGRDAPPGVGRLLKADHAREGACAGNALWLRSP